MRINGFILIMFLLYCKGLISDTVEGTTARTVLSNKIYWTGNNIVKQSNINTEVNVATNAGGEFVFVEPDKVSERGITNKYILKIKNWGNSIDKYELIINATNYSSSPPASNWSAGFIVNNKLTNKISITNGQTNLFEFYIFAPSSASFNSWGEFEVIAKSLNSTNSAINVSIYTGDNENIYGGPTNSGIGAGSNGPTFINIVSNATTNVKNNGFIRLTILDTSVHYVSAITNQNNPGAAVPPYSTPSTAASNLQDAIDVCISGTNTIIFIDNFKEYINASVSYKTNLIIKCANSYDPTIRGFSSDLYGILVEYSSNIEIYGIKLKKFLMKSYSSGIRIYNKSKNIIINSVNSISNSRGLYINDCNDVIVSNSRFVYNTNSGVYLYNGSKNCSFKNNEISTNTKNRFGIYIKNSTNIFIKSNNIFSNNGMGICIASGVSNIAIGDNNIIKNIDYGIGTYSGYKNNIIISNNILKYNNYGIYLNQIDNSFIKNNKVISNKIDGLYIRGSHNIIISSNNMDYNADNGFHIVRNNNNIEIISNFIYYNGTNGIYIEDNGTNIRMEFNKVIGHNPYPKCGVRIDDTATNILIQFNFFKKNSHCIRLTGGSDINIFKNIFFKSTRALNVYSSPENVYFINNSCISNIQGMKPNPNTVVRNNILYGDRDYSLTTDSSTWTIDIYNSYIGSGVSSSSSGTFNLIDCITNGSPEFKSLDETSPDFLYLKWNSTLQNYGYSYPNKPCIGRYSSAAVIYNNSPNVYSKHYLFFTTSFSNNVLPANGLIKVEYLKDGVLTTDFDFSNVTNAMATNGFSGSGANFSISSVNANGYTLKINSGYPTVPGRTEEIIVSSIKNSISEYSNYQVIITVMSNNGALIDGPFKSNFFIINSASISISKSVTNISLAGNSSYIIPGATIEYKIKYQSIKKGNLYKVVIYDKINNNGVFYTNLSSNWTFEVSTNSNPSHDYNSYDYITNYTGAKDKIKFIRWKRENVKYNESGYLLYKIIIK